MTMVTVDPGRDPMLHSLQLLCWRWQGWLLSQPEMAHLALRCSSAATKPGPPGEPLGPQNPASPLH